LLAAAASLQKRLVDPLDVDATALYGFGAVRDLDELAGRGIGIGGRGWPRRISCCRSIYHINNLLTLGASPRHDNCVDGDAMTRQDWLLALRTFVVVYLIL
jgi:hypothetical protein